MSSLDVFRWTSGFPTVKDQFLVLVLGRQPSQTLENKPIRVQAKNMLPRPCNLYRNLPYERGAPVDIYGRNRGILQGAEKTLLTRTI